MFCLCRSPPWHRRARPKPNPHCTRQCLLALPYLDVTRIVVDTHSGKNETKIQKRGADMFPGALAQPFQAGITKNMKLMQFNEQFCSSRSTPSQPHWLSWLSLTRKRWPWVFAYAGSSCPKRVLYDGLHSGHLDTPNRMGNNKIRVRLERTHTH